MPEPTLTEARGPLSGMDAPHALGRKAAIEKARMLEERSLKLDLCALVLLALSVFLTLALVTYDPADSSAGLVYPPHAITANACGRSGALAADILFEALGLGAYYLVVSLAMLDALLLARRKITHWLVRAVGWLLAMVGLTTLAAMALPGVSPGPLIGAGGYLGAAGRGLLEMHFASAGAYILTLSAIAGGLLLCTEYTLVRVILHLLRVSLGGLLLVGRTAGKRKAASPDAADKPSDAPSDPDRLPVRIAGKPNADGRARQCDRRTGGRERGRGRRRARSGQRRRGRAGRGTRRLKQAWRPRWLARYGSASRARANATK